MTRREQALAEIARQEAALNEQFRRQDEWRAKNPAYAEDWERRHPMPFTRLRAGFVEDDDSYLEAAE